MSETEQKARQFNTFWKIIKDLPYKREMVRFDILVEPYSCKLREKGEQPIFFYCENSFRKYGLRVSGTAAILKDEPFGQILFIGPTEEYFNQLKNTEGRR